MKTVCVLSPVCAGRSQRTRQLAEKAGIVDVPMYSQLVTEADLILSIMVPAQAMSAASAVAEALQQVDTTLTYADCNAIAPQTVRELGDVITAAGGTFVDASIIGPPPRAPEATRSMHRARSLIPSLNSTLTG